MEEIFSGQHVDAVFHSAPYGMSEREQVSNMLWIYLMM